MSDPAALAARLRPVTAERWPAFFTAMVDAFGETPMERRRNSPPATAELDRSLSLEDGGRIVATSGAYSRELAVPGAVVPVAAVTWVTVAPTHRRRGVLTAMMRRQLTELHEQQREPVAALWASEHPIYGRFGYAPAASGSALSGPAHRLRLRADVDLGTGRVDVVDEAAYRPAAAALRNSLWRAAPGNLARDERWWDRLLEDDPADRKGASARRYLLHTESDGTVSGYAAYRVTPGWTDREHPDAALTVEEVRAGNPAGYAALWQVLLSIDLVARVTFQRASPADPIRSLLTDPRALTGPLIDTLWVRLVDLDRALAARRYPAPIDLVLEVRDEFCPWNAGRWRLTGHPAGGHCARTDRDPDLVLGVEELASAYLGGTSLATLQAAGRATEVSPGAITLAATAFSWPVPPWCPDDF